MVTSDWAMSKLATRRSITAMTSGVSRTITALARSSRCTFWRADLAHRRQHMAGIGLGQVEGAGDQFLVFPGFSARAG